MFCELLQEEVTDEECTKCWDEQMQELVKEFAGCCLLVGKPRTIAHEDCKKENILRKE